MSVAVRASVQNDTAAWSQPAGRDPGVHPIYGQTSRGLHSRLVEKQQRELRTRRPRGLTPDMHGVRCVGRRATSRIGSPPSTQEIREMRTTYLRLAPLATALALATAAAPAHAALSAVGPMDPATSAPAFYTDANGLQLALCHPGTLNCGPAVPGEDFYNMATSTFTMPNGGTASLTLDMTLAPNADGHPAAFNRVRIQLDGAPAGDYTITHPYGTDTVNVPSAGARGRTTTDIGCAVTAVGPGNFVAPMAGRSGPFLPPAPGAGAPPAGFIGDAVTEVPVTGSPLGTNLFRVDGPGIPAGGAQSNTFALMGKLFGGVVPAFTSSGDVAFADQLISSASTTKTLTVTSAGIPGAGSNLTVGNVALSGANAGDYAIASNTCAGATLPSGSTCTVGLT